MKNLYLLIDVDNSSNAHRVAESLRHRPGIIFVDAVTGPHDVIAVVEGWDKGGGYAKTLLDIRGISGVRYITACHAIRTQFNNGD